jgi:hypothetical protein
MLETFFQWRANRNWRWINPAALAALYLGGALLWVYFFNGGKVPFDRHDWTQTGAYYSFMRNALLSRQLPLHMGSTLVTTDRYLARPDTLLSPQALLLIFLEPGPFMLANVLVMYTLGWVGLLMIRRRYHLALVPFAALLLLFNFNGHITAHLAVGHSEWVGYFILPFFVLLVLKLVDGEGDSAVPKAGWGWTLSMALVLFGLVLQGAFHFFLWCLIFLGGLGLFHPRYARAVIKAGLAGGLLSLVRLLPPAIEYIHGGVMFNSGFPTLTDLLTALTVIRTPLEVASLPNKSLGWWEVDTYVGLAGLAFLLYFGVYRTWSNRSRPGGQGAAHLLAPLFLVGFLSIGQVYRLISSVPLPLFDSERISSRFMIVPLVVLVVLGSVQLQHFFDEGRWQGWRVRLLAVGLLVLMGHDLVQHTRIWRVVHMADLFPSTPVDIRSLVTNHPDPPYFTALAVGLAGTLLALVILVILAGKESHQKS